MTTTVEQPRKEVWTSAAHNTEHEKTHSPTPKRRMLHLLAGGVVVAIAGGVATAGTHYWRVGRFLQTTDDAYIKADSTIVAPKVSGYVAQVLVDDHQTVKAGQPLARIDERDLRTALAEAKANVAVAAASIDHLDAQLVAQNSVIRQADATVASATAVLGLSERNDTRRQKMAEVGYGSVEQADSASTDVRESHARLDAAHAAADSAREQVGILSTQRKLAEAQLTRAQAIQHQAELNLEYTGIVAPIDGTVAARSVRAGQYVQAGTQLMALVPLQRVYVIANFKETQLTHVEAGQTARVRVDTFPEHDLIGHVDSVAPATGMEFSLLPPDNATGNFTKIVQRVPIKIVFPTNTALSGRIRPGMSVEASIDTRESNGAHNEGE